MKAFEEYWAEKYPHGTGKTLFELSERAGWKAALEWAAKEGWDIVEYTWEDSEHLQDLISIIEKELEQ